MFNIEKNYVLCAKQYHRSKRKAHICVSSTIDTIGATDNKFIAGIFFGLLVPTLDILAPSLHFVAFEKF